MKHIPFCHTWTPVFVHHFYDTSWGEKAPSTKVTSMCVCGKLKTTLLYNAGFIELKDLLSANKPSDV